VTGISSCEMDGSEIKPVVLVRDAADLEFP